MAVQSVLGCAAALLAVSVLAVAGAGRAWSGRVVYGLCLTTSLVVFAVALSLLLDPPSTAPAATLPLGLPWIGASARIDSLAAFFLVVVNMGGAAASLFGIGYGRHERAPQRVLPFFPAFLAGMNMVVVAADAFTFLLSWEFMSLTSWALVMAHHREGDNARAGYVYLVMASFGTLTLLLAFGLLAGPGGAYAFADMRTVAHTPFVAGLALILVLIGAGSKAGLVPLHAWLPLAHPAAPSHVSALMSGVMTKVAVYGFIRVAFDLLSESPWWAGMTIMTVGAATAVMGVLYALMQTDMKKFLACSTIENIGIIFIGLGLAHAFRANDLGWVAALAATAALFHVLNHSLFKSLLFFGAGAVLAATHERDMERLGGLIHRMPWTAFFFLVGCVAISALPPLNGFVSEWLTFQAILQSPVLSHWGLKILVPAIGGLLALSAALVGAAFVRAFGIAFLGRPRSAAAEGAREFARPALAAMATMAALCLAAGILPGFVIDALSPVVSALTGDRVPAQAARAWLSIVPTEESANSYNGLLVFLFIALSASLSAFFIHRFASRNLRRAPAWDCGFPEPSPMTQYTAGSFAQPLRRVFATAAFGARERVEMPPPGDVRPARLRLDLRDPIWAYAYAPLAAAILGAAGRLNFLQFLTIRRYLSLVFLALVSLLTVVAIWS